jgi:hypothetical protein
MSQGNPMMPMGNPMMSGNPMMPMGNPMMPPNMPPATSNGVMPASYPPPGAVAALGALAEQVRFPVQRTQVRFVRPSGMRVSWTANGPDGKPTYSNVPLETPARYNFLQASIYRLKLSNIPGRPGLEVYPTLEVVPTNFKTEAFLAHSAVPVDFTDEDFKQITEGNYVVKVIYLPDPQYQELAGTGTEEILSTRLEPGANPIDEARRRGSILLVIRMGNMDQEAPNTPPISAPGSATGASPQMGMPPGFQGPLPMVPYFGPRPVPTNPNGPIQIGPMPPWMAPPHGANGQMPPGAVSNGPPMGGPGMPPFGVMPPNMGPNGAPSLPPPPGGGFNMPPPNTGPFVQPRGGMPVFGPPPGSSSLGSGTPPALPAAPPLPPEVPGSNGPALPGFPTPPAISAPPVPPLPGSAP